MIPVLEHGWLNPRIAADPRWSAAQRDAAAKAAETDPDARVEGMDGKMRPVVRARLHGPAVSYALMRNGAPAKVTKPLAEEWRPTRRSTR